MISYRVVAASLVTALLTFSPTFAATVTNRDGEDRKVTVVEGEIQKDHVVKPSGVLRDVCQKGCLIRLDDSDDDPYELEGSEVTSIEGGQLYDDGLEALGESPTGDAGQPSQPSPQP